MAMEGVLRSSSLAALLFLTLVLVAASASDSASCGGGGDGYGYYDVAAAAGEETQKQCHPRADEPYMLVAFHNKDSGEEIRVLTDQRSHLLSGVTGYANKSGHWFCSPVRARREEDGSGRRRRRRLVLLPQPQPHSDNNRVGAAEGLWNTLGVVQNATGATAVDNDDEQEAVYVLLGMETSGGDKKRFVVVADQSYFSITGFAQGFIIQPRWFFSDRPRNPLLQLGGGNGSSSSSSHGSNHAEVVASSVVAALINEGRSCR